VPQALKPDTFTADPANLPPALHVLIAQKCWVVWRWMSRADKQGVPKWTKPPYQAKHPKRAAKSNDPSTWGSYQDAVAAVKAGLADGIGYMLLDSELVAIDLDKCRNAVTGELCHWGQQLFDEASRLGFYIEVTVSGTGLRFIGTTEKHERLQRRFPFHRSSGEGVELYRHCERYITINGLQQGACETLPPADDYVDELLKRYDDPAKLPKSKLTIDFNTAPKQDLTEYYRDLIENGAPEGQRSEAFAEVVWYLAGQGMTIEEIEAELRQHPNGIASKYWKRLTAEISRCYHKWRATQLAQVAWRKPAGGPSVISASIGTPTSGPGSPWPQIKIIPGELPRVVNEAEEALIKLEEDIFQRGGILVHTARGTTPGEDGKLEGWEIVQFSKPYMVVTLCRAAQFLRWDKREQKWTPTDASARIAEAMLANRADWKLPVLRGIVLTPFLRGDGSICEKPGYDPASQLLFKADQIFPTVPQAPTKEDARAALKVLTNLINTFPFVEPFDKSVALAAMLTVVDRGAMETAPMFAFTSPVAGSGKSILVDACSILATGCRLSCGQISSSEELTKLLGAKLLAGSQLISLDNANINSVIDNDMLCQALTQTKVDVRILGQSRVVACPTVATIMATGNNLTIGGDATRRSLLCSIDPQCERPETRVFCRGPFLDEVEDRRIELVTAILIILRAWHVSPDRMAGLTPYGSFEAWSYRIREPLIWLDETDPCNAIEKIRENDPHRDQLALVIEQWRLHLKIDQTYTLQTVIGRAIVDQDFHGALLAVATSRGSSVTVSNDRLGRWMKRNEGRIVNGYRLIKHGICAGYPLWKLVKG
jgi:hypothetical protein